MANTFFYSEARKESGNITWREILSECRKKHTKEELEYAMSAGTSLNTATESDMLDKWRKPWVFLRVLIIGLILIAILYIAIIPYWMGGNVAAATLYMALILPPLVVPFVLMIFIWELNIPKNISIYQLLIWLVVGGVISFAVTVMLSNVIGEGPGIFVSSTAAFREEPAKLVAALIFLIIFSKSKNKKIYGLSGLVIGAAVGSGFGAFESLSYAMAYGFFTQIIRMICAIGGHTIYCAPYMGAIALHMKDNRLSAESFLNKDFILTFILSIGMHFFWNMSVGGVIGWAINIATIVILWAELLYITKKCLHQAVDIGRQQQNRGPVMADAPFAQAMAIRVTGISGVLKGAVWDSGSGQALTIGRGEGSVFRYPEGTNGVSRRHCSIRKTSAGWALRDEGSSYGTYLNGQNRLTPGEDRILKPGDIFYIGGRANAFRVLQK